MTRRQLLPFMIVAWAGVLTTLLNTTLPMFASGADMVRWRDVVMLFHAPATLVPVIGLALLTGRDHPFTASAAVLATFLEKSLEFVGQALRLFPPEESFGAIPAADIVASVWDQLFFVLWTCNTIGATCVGFMLAYLLPKRTGWFAAACAWGAGLLTAVMMAGPDYLGWPMPAVPGLLFAIMFTAYRVAMAITLHAKFEESARS